MNTSLMLIPPLITTTPSISPFPKTHHSTTSLPSSRQHQARIHTTNKFGNFHDLKPKNKPYGVLAEVDAHSFDLDKIVLMDWRYYKVPTFMYAMPFTSNLIFLEETSLVSRPALSHKKVKRGVVARLRHLEIRVKSVSEDEKGLIPLGESLPKLPKNVIVFH
jgi:lycopene cyclase-like protein